MVRNPNTVNRFGSYAYFPGTGPAGRVCADCAASHTVRGLVYCRTFAVITGKKGRPIKGDTPSCRDYQRRERQEITE
jgi:hypothetical protein